MGLEAVELEELVLLIVEWKRILAATGDRHIPLAMVHRMAELMEAEIDLLLEGEGDSENALQSFKILTTIILSAGNADFMTELIKSYILESDNADNNIAAMRLLVDFIPEETFPNQFPYCNTTVLTRRLYEWALTAEEPLKTYAIGLLARTMEVEKLVVPFHDYNLQLVPQVLKELRELKTISQSQSHESDSAGASSPKPSTSGKSPGTKAKGKQFQASLKKVHCLVPMTVTSQIILRLRYLTYACIQKRLSSLVLDNGVMDLALYYCDFRSNHDYRVTITCLRMLGFLLVVRQAMKEFLVRGGLEIVLKTPQFPPAIQLLSLLLSGGHLLSGQMPTICRYPKHVLTDLMSYEFVMVNFREMIPATNGKLAMLMALSRPVFVEIFYKLNGLRKMFELTQKELPKTEEILKAENSNSIKDKWVSVMTTPLKLDYLIIKLYLLGHIYIKGHRVLHANAEAENRELPLHQELHLAREVITDMMDAVQDEAISSMDLPEIQEFRELNIMEHLLQMVSTSVSVLPKEDECDMKMSILGAIQGLVSFYDFIPMLCQPIRVDERVEHIVGKYAYGIRIVISQILGRFLNSEEVKFAAFEILTQCVRATKSEESNEAMAAAKCQIRRCVRDNGGIRIMISALDYCKDLNKVDSYRWLATKALIGMAYRDEDVRLLLSKLPVFHGPLQEMMKRPAKEDQVEHYKYFVKYGSDLLDILSGKSQDTNTPPIGADLEKLSLTEVSSDRELFELMHEHLVSQGLTDTAESLKQEANLAIGSTYKQQSHNSINSALTGLQKTEEYPSAMFSKFPFSSTSSSPSARQEPQLPSGKIKMKWNKTRRPYICENPYLCNIGTLSASDKTSTFSSMMKEYLKQEQALCERNACSCLEYSLTRLHKCSAPKQRIYTPGNMLQRQQRKQISPTRGGIEGRRIDKQRVYSSFRPLKTLPSSPSEGFTCVKFPKFQYPLDNPTLMLGTTSGHVNLDLHVSKDKVKMSTFKCHDSAVLAFELSKDSRLMVTSCQYLRHEVRRPVSVLWKFADNSNGLSLQHGFLSDSYMSFSNTSDDMIVSNRGLAALVYDTETGGQIVKLKDDLRENRYRNNKAIFDPTDTMVLSNGILWDVRSGGIVHQFDKIHKSSFYNAKIHPTGLHLLIKDAMWDMRTYKLMTTVPDLGEVHELLEYNMNGDVLFGATSPYQIERLAQSDMKSFFRTFDPDDQYRTIASIEMKWNLLSLDIDPSNQLLAMNLPLDNMESLLMQRYTNYRSVCRVYEIGRPLKADIEDMLEDTLDGMLLEEAFREALLAEEDM